MFIAEIQNVDLIKILANLYRQIRDIGIIMSTLKEFSFLSIRNIDEFSSPKHAVRVNIERVFLLKHMENNLNIEGGLLLKHKVKLNIERIRLLQHAEPSTSKEIAHVNIEGWQS